MLHRWVSVTHSPIHEQYITEDLSPQEHCCGNLRSHTIHAVRLSQLAVFNSKVLDSSVFKLTRKYGGRTGFLVAMWWKWTLKVIL